jgi:adenylate kinase family enzyme
VRISVVGTSGSGKTTLAKALAGQTGLPHIELDALNWQAGWRDLSRGDPDEFVRRVATAVASDAWVVDGNYGLVRDLVWRRATHLIWLDYQRPVIMHRVIRRSLARAVLRTELWAGNRERWLHMLRPSHPIRWAWSSWPRRRESMRSASGSASTPISSSCVCAGRGSRKAAPSAHATPRRAGAERLDRVRGGLVNAEGRAGA